MNEVFVLSCVSLLIITTAMMVHIIELEAHEVDAVLNKWFGGKK